MPTQITNTKSAEHYNGEARKAPTATAGTSLKRPSSASSKSSFLPAPARYATTTRARQFFYDLEGELTLEVDHRDFVFHTGEGLEVLPNQQHQAMNRGTKPVRMLVTSQPPSHGDRVIA